MKKLILIIISTLISSAGYCQNYNLKFQVKQEADNLINKDWDYQFSNFFSSSPCYISFDGKILKMGNSSVKHFEVNVISIKKVEKTETIYGNKVVIGEYFILGTNGEHCIEYYILHKDNLQQGGHIYTLYRPFIFDGKLLKYHLYKSGKIL